MKNTTLTHIAYCLIIFVLLLPNIVTKQQTKNNIQEEICIEEEICEVEPLVLPQNFNVIYNSFKSYNPYVDTLTAIKFTQVSNHFGLTKDDETIKWTVGQILLESGAKQYYQPTHPKEGELLVSSAGAIGFTQILPSTAYGYLVKELSYEEKDCFKELGATDFSFAYSDNCTKQEKIDMTKVWLTNETNNIIMWGKIMNDELETKSLIEALIAYNAGRRGLDRYLDAGNEKMQHDYIVGIQARLKYVDT